MTSEAWFVFALGLGILGACGPAAHPADTASTAAPSTDARQAELDAGGPAADAAQEASSVALSPEAGAPATTAAPAPASAPVFDTQGPTYPAASLREVFDKNQAKLLGCFEPGRKRDPKPRGHVNIKFTIGQSGKAGAVQDQGSNLPDAQVIACVVKVIKSLHFTKPEGSVTVVYPFIFHSSEPFLILPDSAAPSP
jgi:hypothetical protein